MEKNVLLMAKKYIQELEKKLGQSRFPGPVAELNIRTRE